MQGNHAFEKIVEEIASPDRLLVALFALFLVLIIGFFTGPLSGNANPYFWNLFDKILGNTARKAYIKEKSYSALLFRGAFFTTGFILLAGIFGAGLYLLKRYMPLGGATEIILLALLCTGGAALVSLKKLYDATQRDAKDKNDKRGSFAPIAISQRLDLNSTDEFGINRAGIAFMPQAFDRGLVYPLFWYLIGGLPLAFLASGVTAAKWALAKNGFAKAYGVYAISLEKLFGFLPRIVSSVLLWLAAALTPKAGIFQSLKAFFSFKNHAPSAEGGMPLTITAFALNVTLGGAVQDVEGSTLQQKFVGDSGASARVDSSVLKQACYMGFIAHILLVLLLLGLLMVMRAASSASVAAISHGAPVVAPLLQ